MQDRGTKILSRSQAAFIREAVGELRLMATNELTIASELLKMADELEGELLRLSCADLEQLSLC